MKLGHRCDLAKGLSSEGAELGLNPGQGVSEAHGLILLKA